MKYPLASLSRNGIIPSSLECVIAVILYNWVLASKVQFIGYDDDHIILLVFIITFISLDLLFGLFDTLVLILI